MTSTGVTLLEEGFTTVVWYYTRTTLGNGTAVLTPISTSTLSPTGLKKGIITTPAVLGTAYPGLLTTTNSAGNTIIEALYSDTTIISVPRTAPSSSTSTSAYPTFPTPKSGGLSGGLMGVIIITVVGSALLCVLAVLLGRWKRKKLETLRRLRGEEAGAAIRYPIPHISQQAGHVGGTLPTCDEAQRTLSVGNDPGEIARSHRAWLCTEFGEGVRG